MRFKSIDSFRGLAAAFVVCYHLWNRFYPGITTQDHLAVVPHGAVGSVAFFLFGFGYLGVNLFFVVSGFCIHLPQALKFHASGSDRLKIGSFAERRFWRLYPAYFASLIWTSVALLAIPSLVHLVRRTPMHFYTVADVPDFVTSALFLQQIHPKALGFNGVYWTLVYEVQFYLFYPVLLFLCRRFGFRLMLMVLLAAEIGLVLRPVPIPLFFLSRCYEWFLGMYLAEWFASGRERIKLPMLAFPAVLMLAFASVFYAPTWPYRDVLASTAFAALLLTWLPREQPSAWLCHPWLVALGISSYSLYLIHVPVLDIAWNGLRLVHEFVPRVPQTLSILSVVLCYWMAQFFYRTFEAPFVHGYTRRPAARVAGANTPVGRAVVRIETGPKGRADENG